MMPHIRLHALYIKILIIIGVAVTLTSSIGNWGYWKTLGLQPVPHVHTTASGITTHTDTHYATVTSSLNASLTVYHLHTKVHTVQLTTIDQPTAVQSLLHIRIDIRDTTGIWHTGTTQLVSSDHAATHILPQQTYTDTATAVRVVILESQGTRIAVTDLGINTPVPWHFDIAQCVCWMLLTLLVIMFRPRSILWKIPIGLSQYSTCTPHLHASPSAPSSPSTTPIPAGSALTPSPSKSSLSAVPAMILKQSTIRTAMFVFAWCSAIVMMIISACTAWWGAEQQYHMPHSYTYDFNQYANAAQALLEGHPWLDLPVVQDFAHLANPYDPQARMDLLNQGTQPIYWDHAYYNGHWYSYFGVLPMLVLYVPFQAISSLLLHGTLTQGILLPTSFVATCCLILAAMGMLHVIVRYADLYTPRIPIATVLIVSAGCITGCGLWYLSIRSAFYEVALGSGLMCTMWGLWFWLGARARITRQHYHSSTRHRMLVRHCARIFQRIFRYHRIHQCQRTYTSHPSQQLPHTCDRCQPGTGYKSHKSYQSDNIYRPGNMDQLGDNASYNTSHNAARLSLPHMIAGCICMAATLGCRVPMIAASLLWLPIFQYEWRSGMVLRPLFACILPRRARLGAWKDLPLRKRIVWHSWKLDICIIASVALVWAPVLAMNVWRFGSITDFGNAYQITVTDMVHRITAPAALMHMLAYYLIQPVSFINTYPYLAPAYTPIEPWAYSDVIVGGLLWIAPAVLLALLTPWMRRIMRTISARGQHDTPYPCAYVLLLLGCVVCVAVTWMAGLDWRYITDFAWYWLLAAALVTFTLHAALLQRAAYQSIRISGHRGYSGHVVLIRLLLGLCLLSFCITCIMSVFQPFATNQAMSIMKYNPDTYATLYAWLMWL